MLRLWRAISIFWLEALLRKINIKASETLIWRCLIRRNRKLSPFSYLSPLDINNLKSQGKQLTPFVNRARLGVLGFRFYLGFTAAQASCKFMLHFLHGELGLVLGESQILHSLATPRTMT